MMFLFRMLLRESSNTINLWKKYLRTEISGRSPNARMRQKNKHKCTEGFCKFIAYNRTQRYLFRLDARKKRSHYHQVVDMTMKAGSKNFLHGQLGASFRILMIGQ
jgi:hypothetical protein